MCIQERRRRPGRIYTVLKQKNSKDSTKAYVLFEGPTDRALWSEYVASRCELVRAYNREGALAVLKLVNAREPSWRNVAAIIDPDYLLVENSEELQTPNLLYDDAPDLEMSLLDSPALEKVLRNTFIHMESNDIVEFTTLVMSKSTRLGAEFGYFRLIDFRNRRYNLSFNKVSFEDVADVANETIDHDMAAKLLVQSSSLTADELTTMVSQLRVSYPPSRDLCRGKDVISLITLVAPIVYRDTVGKDLSAKAKIQFKSDELYRTLRMAYEFAYFICTQLYRRIREWESAHRPYRIIRDYPAERTPA